VPDIFHDFPIKVASTPAELDQWWTVRSTGEPLRPWLRMPW